MSDTQNEWRDLAKCALDYAKHLAEERRVLLDRVKLLEEAVMNANQLVRDVSAQFQDAVLNQAAEKVEKG